MLALRRSTSLSLLLLAVASTVKGNGTATVTLFKIAVSEVMTSASAIGLGANGGTAYVEDISVSGVLDSTLTVTDLFTATVTQAASWLYEAEPDPSGDFNSLEWNCTLGTNECIEISRERNGASIEAVTTTFTGHILPLYTLTVSGSIVVPTSATSAATTLGNPIFNRLSSMIFFVVMLVLVF